MMKRLMTALVISTLITSCTTTATGENPYAHYIGGAVGGALAGFGGNKLDSTLGTGYLFTSLGAGLGAIIGGELARYLTSQDKHNIEQVLVDTKQSQAVAWCSNSKSVSKNVNGVQCGNANKIVATPGKAAPDSQGETCRSMKTEVVKANGDIETETQNLCQAKDGQWHEKTA